MVFKDLGDLFFIFYFIYPPDARAIIYNNNILIGSIISCRSDQIYYIDI